MLLTWTPEFIHTALSTLTEQERSAIHLASDGARKAGTVQLRKGGFASTQQYAAALEIARAKLKRWFAAWGISNIDDLPFVEPGCSTEGRIQRAAKGRKK